MALKFQELVSTPAVADAQKHYYGKARPHLPAPGNDRLTEDEIAFIGARDSFYLATVNENGWPYIQHRGGPRGFLHVLEPGALAFADYKGNHQLLSTGNLAANDRVALFLMDYPHQTRLKILGHARVEDASLHPNLVAQLATPEARSSVERLFFIDVVSFDWNCPQHITPRYTEEEIRTAIAPLQQRMAELEEKLRSHDGFEPGPAALEQR
jgi:predicted pyridoxine 5'-phosphate oxidase superfamily flavin-nucleotide-binding protein